MVLKIVLASASPRRKELLDRIGIGDFTVLPSETGEETGLPAEEAVGELSRRKAEDAASRCAPGTLVIAADTLVVCGGEVLGKPGDEADACRMLRLLSGRRHTVFTGVTVLRDGRARTETEETGVYVRRLTDGEIRAYVATGEPMDKAGAYGIQERGALLVRRIDGDFYNVMGLPLCLLSEMLGDFGVDLLSGGN